MCLDVSQQLKYVGMPFMKQVNCDKIFSKTIDFRLDKDMICTDSKSHCDVSLEQCLEILYPQISVFLVTRRSCLETCGSWR